MNTLNPSQLTYKNNNQLAMIGGILTSHTRRKRRRHKRNKRHRSLRRQNRKTNLFKKTLKNFFGGDEDFPADPSSTPMPEQTVPEQTMPEQTVPEQTVPEQTMPELSPAETATSEIPTANEEPMQATSENNSVVDAQISEEPVVQSNEDVINTIDEGTGATDQEPESPMPPLHEIEPMEENELPEISDNNEPDMIENADSSLLGTPPLNEPGPGPEQPSEIEEAVVNDPVITNSFHDLISKVIQFVTKEMDRGLLINSNAESRVPSPISEVAAMSETPLEPEPEPAAPEPAAPEPAAPEPEPLFESEPVEPEPVALESSVPESQSPTLTETQTPSISEAESSTAMQNAPEKLKETISLM